MSAPWDDGAALIAHQVRDAFADADAARMRELDRLIARGFGKTDPRNIPVDEPQLSPAAPPPPAPRENT